MPKDFVFPDIGEGIHEGRVVKWHANVGDYVIADKTLVEVETDKAVVEIPSPFTGIIAKRNYEEGDIVPVGSVLVQIEEQESESLPGTSNIPKSEPVRPFSSKEPLPQKPIHLETPIHQDHSPFLSSIVAGTTRNSEPVINLMKESSEVLKIASSPKPLLTSSLSRPTNPIRLPATQNIQTVSTLPVGSSILATPSTRRLARELGVDLAGVRGNGPGGRIMDEDVRNKLSSKSGSPSITSFYSAIAHEKEQIVATPKPVQTQVPIQSRITDKNLSNSSTPIVISNDQDERIPLSGMRKVIAERMTYSKTHIPHACGMDFIDVTRLVEIREREKKNLEPKGIKLTYLPFVIKACAMVLRKYPFINANFDESKNEIILKKDINISIAVDTKEGLTAPVIKNANQKSVLELAHEIETLAVLAREKKLKLEDLRGGSFTITNVGSVGGFFSTPIINPPEVAIMGIHRIKDMPLVVEHEESNGEKVKKIEARKVMGLSLCFDHRVLDGAMATEFMNAVKTYLEDPDMMLLSMV